MEEEWVTMSPLGIYVTCALIFTFGMVGGAFWLAKHYGERKKNREK